MGVRISGGALIAASLIALLFLLSSSNLPAAQDYSFGNLGFSCGDLGVGSCFATGNQLGGGIGYGYCIPYYQCYFVNESFSGTFYTSYAGNGSIIRSPISGQVSNPIPVIKDVIQTNNKYSPYLITCPVAPNPTNSIEYISDPGTYIAGNRCLASILPLVTEVSLTTQVSFTNVGYFINLAGWTTGSAPTSASSSYSMSNMARGDIKDLAFSGQASVNGSTYNLAASYNTKSYIFQQVNSTTQQGLWTWTAEYADLSRVNLGYLNLNYDSSKDSATAGNLESYYQGFDLGLMWVDIIPIVAPFPVGCLFSYNFDVHSYVAKLANANIPIPVYNTTLAANPNSKNYLKIGGYIYSPVKTISSSMNPSSCYQQLLAGGPGCQATSSTLLGSLFGRTKKSVTNWLKIGTNATAYYNGNVYNNLPVYLNSSNTLDINQLTSYYGVMVRCEPPSAWRTSPRGGIDNPNQPRCWPFLFLPQSVAQDSNGNPNPSAILQYITAQMGMSGSSELGLHLYPANSRNCEAYNGGTGSHYFSGSYSLSEAEAETGYQLQYCVASRSGSITDKYGEQMCRGSYSCALYIGVSTNPLNGNALNLTYAVPINGQVLLETNSIIGVDFKNVSIFPYITYNATIPSTYSQFTPASFLNLSYAVYSPNNYASTTNAFGVLATPIEPYNLFSGSGLLANYSTPTRKSELVDFPFSISAASSNTFYDEFPIVVGGTTTQTNMAIPISNALSYSVTFTDNSISPFLGANSLLNVKYPPNTIIYVSSAVDNQSGLPACFDDWVGGACIGNVNFTDPVALTNNTFIFGNISILYGATVQTKGHSIITSGVIDDPSAVIAGYKTGSVSLSNHGTAGFTNITNPAFIAESPNGYVYVINYTNTCGFLCFKSTTKSYIFKMKYIPTGYYNYSVYQPNNFQQQTKLGKWINQSENYFRGALLAETPSLYILGASQFTSTTAPNWCIFSLCLGSVSVSGSSQAPFQPLAAAADYQGDLFLVGSPVKGSYPNSFALAEITASGTITVDTSINQPTGFTPTQEFAVSPGGEYVYLANPNYPAINIYSTKGGDFQYVGNIPLTYSNSSYNMNITAYLAHGGPFHTSSIQSGYQSSSMVLNDIPEFHHPLAISEVQGTIFVIDNWTFGTLTYTGQTSTSTISNPIGSVWMLRAFEANGIEIPMSYSTNKTMSPAFASVQSSSPLLSPVQTGYTYWPPYGWPLTANITTSSGGTAVSICEYSGSGACSTYGSISGFNSVGPQITTNGALFTETASQRSEGYLQYATQEQLGISADFNGAIYLIIHDAVAAKPYTQLLVLKPNIENYTKLSIGESMPFQCYSNITSMPDCMTANFISGLYPPLLAMPDAFEFLSGQGSALQYFSLTAALSSLFPVGGSSSSAVSWFTSGAPGGSNYDCLATNPPSSCGNVNAYSPTGVLRTYINSTLKGYVITPFNIDYVLKQTWDFYDGEMLWETPSVTYFESVCDYNPDPKSGETNLYVNQVTNLSSNFLNHTIEGGGIYAQYNLTQSNYQPNISDQNLIMPPYIFYSVFTNRLFGEIYVNQTITPSMASSMSSQLESYLTNNLGSLGSIISGFTGTAPKVVNATRNYNYTEDIYIQTIYNPFAQGFDAFSTAAGSSLSSFEGLFSTGGCIGTLCAPAYLAENAMPTGVTPNNTILGANCGGSCPGINAGGVSTSGLTDIFGTNPTSGLPSQVGALTGLSGYYYGTNYLNANSLFNYTVANQTSYFQLFSLFKKVSYLYGLQLNLSSIPQVYGYNRLLYTYVDRFNNTVYMPVDVDFANITFVALNVTSNVNITNVNQSQINVTGTVEYLRPDGSIVPAPLGSSVYLYYDTNLNYNNATALASGLSVLGSSYYKWAENCAFDPQDRSCVLTSPLSTYGLSQLQITNLLAQSNQPTYKPNFNESGKCAPQPKSLLAFSNYNCNLHGSALGVSLPGQLPAVATGPNGNQQYCVPEFTNGTGMLTSQLGLVGTFQTNSIGGFNAIITACGVGTGKIIAQYYGYPPPEPISVVQTTLPHSVVPLSSDTANDIISPEYNYYFSPNSTSSTFQIGSYQLSLGNFYAWIPIIIILILLMASKSSLGSNGSIFELFGFATLYDMAKGISGGGGGKGKGIRSQYKIKPEKYVHPFFDRKGDKKEAAEAKKRLQAVSESNFYEFLGLTKMPSSMEEAQAAYRSQMKAVHPDVSKDPDAAEKAKNANVAYERAKEFFKKGGGMVKMSVVGKGMHGSRRGIARSAQGLGGKLWSSAVGAYGAAANDVTRIHYETIGSYSGATNEELKGAYEAKLGNINKDFEKKVYEDAEKKILKPAYKNKPGLMVAEKLSRDQRLREVQQSWNWIKKQHGIVDEPKSDRNKQLSEPSGQTGKKPPILGSIQDSTATTPPTKKPKEKPDNETQS